MSVPSARDRHARMLRLLRQLQCGGGLNATELATQLNVCRRTIFRDLHTMRRAGVDVIYDERLDGYRLGSRNRSGAIPTLDQEELTLLAAAVQMSALHQLPGCGVQLRQSVTKLLTTLPHSLQHRVTRAACAFHVPDDPPVQARPAADVVRTLVTAISHRRLLLVAIVDPETGDEVETHFAPYQLLAAGESWQVVGHSSHHRSVQQLDPRRLRRPVVTDDAYAVPRRFQTVP